MNDVFVTCIKNGRFDRFGRPLESGSSYTLSWSLARDLWLSGYVSVTDASVFDSGSVDVRRPNLAAELAAIGPQNAAVFVIGGQSNADGRGSLSSPAPSSPSVWMLDKGGVTRLATEPLGDQSGNWINNVPSGVSPSSPAHSLGVALGKSAAQITGNSAVLVPCAIGSTSMSHWRPPAGTLDMTTLFGALILRAQAAQKSGQSPIFVWYGHEANAADTVLTTATGAISTHYQGRWYALIESVRAYFPAAPFIFAQLGASNDAAIATRHCITGEAQRQSADTGSPAAVANITLGPLVPKNTNGTNTITALDDGSVQMVGDGTTTLGFGYSGLSSGTQYLVSVTVTGSGLWKLLCDSPAVQTSSFTAGTHELLFTADGVAGFNFYRYSNGDVTNLNFKITAVRSVSTKQIANTHMVVAHDLPRISGSSNIHLETPGLLELGRRMALIYAERVLQLLGVDGLGPRLVSVTSTDSTHTKVKFSQQIAAAKAGETNYSDGTDSLFRVYDAGTERAVSTVAIDGADNTALIITHAAVSGVRVVQYGNRAAQDAVWRKGVVYNTAAIPLPAPLFVVVAT